MLADRRASALGLAALLVALLGLLVMGPARSRAAAPAGAARHLTIALQPRHPAALSAYAQAVSTPGSPEYGHYLSPAQVAARFGAGPRQIASVRRALRDRGVRAGAVSAGGLSIAAHASPRAVQALRSGIAGPLPRAVQSVLGVDNAVAAHPLAVRASRTRRARLPAARRHVSAPGPQPCAAVALAAPAQGAYTADEIASAYGFDALYAAGDEGAGVTVAVYELEPNDPADIAAFQHCYGTHARVSYLHVDGGAGAGAGSDEAAFDIENVIGFAPRARVLVYQAPNSESGLPGSGPYDAFSAIINQDRAQVVSVSWGQCEAQLGVAAARAEHVLFEQAAVQGQTIVAAAGDNGAEDCLTGGHNTSVAPAVDDPAAQPEVIGVGGTTLPSAIAPLGETVWNSAGTGSGLGPGAGGGGVSSLWKMSADQRDAPPRLHVNHAAAAGPVCGQRRGPCREVPDVAADADPTTGYAIYWNGADTVPAPSGWQGLGGTSGAAPLWAALFALADAAPACHDTPLGFAGPALYRAAARHYAADFHDITEGDDDFTHTDDGRWPAAAGYDLASGLGTPDASRLVASMCANAVRLAPVGGQSSARGAGVSISLHGSDVRGATLRYGAEHLPPGVRVQAGTGRLIGTPQRPGRYRVRAFVRDGQGARASRLFTWSIGGAPHLTAALRGSRLSLTVRSGPHVPWLQRVRIAMSSGLTLAGHSAIAVRARGNSSLRVRSGVVTIALDSPAPSVAATLAVCVSTTAPIRVGVRARTGSTGTSRLFATVDGGAR